MDMRNPIFDARNIRDMLTRGYYSLSLWHCLMPSNNLSKHKVNQKNMKKQDCTFCKIVSGEIPASVIFEDEVCMAFMDVFPVNEGHCLLIPKDHFENMLDVNPEVASHLAVRLRELTKRVHGVYAPTGIINAIANGSEAGQEIPHLHIHVIPRKAGDEFGFRFPEGYRDEMASREQLEETGKKLSNVNVRD
ncbi:HIT family protein [Candidatus Thorarchaeota archaeon]|nr:MAG: HIT family protein [Candidatus Thorarchaeota archaeon]